MEVGLQVEFVLRQLLQFICMSPQQLAEKMKKELQQGSALSTQTLNDLKKYFDELKNNQNPISSRPQQVLAFKEKVIHSLLSSLVKNQHNAKDKILVLEILERDLISSKHNVALFNKLYTYLLDQDENVAIQASKAIDALIKQINQGQQATANATLLETKAHYLKLFEFLKDKTEFLIKLSEHVKDPEFKVYRRQNYEQRDQRQDRERDKKEIVFKNSKSLKFINQVPHLFIHLMAYVDASNRSADDDGKIKDLIRKSIDNIIQSLRKTPYQEFYNEFNYDFNNELFGVMTKLLQFLFINLRSDKEQSGNTTKSNANLKKHIADQIQYIKVNEVIKNFIHLLKNCSEDFQLNRYQIVNRLKLLLNNLDKNKLNKNDALQILGEILNEQTIFGRRRILGDYSKNAICSYWIQMIRSPVLLTHIFPTNILSVKAAQQNNLNEDSPEITSCFNHIERLMEEVLKTMFDNAFYPSVQQKCIELITYLIDQLFPDGTDNIDNLNAIGANSGAAKRIQENKLRILLRILDCASLKLSSIRHTFEQIDEFVTRKLGHKISKKELPEPLRLDHMQLNSLNVSIAESKSWQKEAVDFIMANQQEIDGSLLTVSAVQNKFITIYQQEDELCFNSHPVKINNYTMYMKEVKTKLLQKCITLAHKITKIFLSQNIEMYNPMEVASLKSIYFILTNKRALTADQCKILSSILKNGLKIFQILHIYDLHSDEQTNKKGHLKNFMLIFAQIYDPVNFRDIFEPNMDEFFRNLINYAKNCADFCLQFVLIEPYCSNNNSSQPFNKNIVELLTYNLILRLESTSDQLDPFHQFYSYKQEYFLLLQKLIRFPFRCLSRYSDESFIRNYFRQIILFLTKKAHTSRFCLDYLHLMRTLFKNILFNSNREAASPLFIQFYAICCKNSQSMQGQNNAHSIFINVNILDNFLRLYETGIPQLADIITELVIMLPLKSKHIIQFAKQGYIVKPLLHCLCLMSDYNYLLRTLKTFEIIISHSSAEEIAQFLDGVRDKLINRLFQMVSGQFKTNDLRPEKINNDLSSLSLKLLAKLGALSRNRDPPICLNYQMQLPSPSNPSFQLIFQREKGQQITTPLANCIQYALEVFLKLLDSYYQSIIFISMELIEKSFDLLVSVLPLTLKKMDPLAEKIINVFTAVLALSSKYLTIAPSIQVRIREQVKNQIKNHAENVKKQLKTCGLTQYCKFFLRSLVMNLNERVLITRQQNFIKEISQQPKKFIWGLLTGIIDETKGSSPHNEIVQFLIKLLISSSVMLRNPHQIKLNPYQNDYNHILPFKNAALGALNQLIDKAPFQILQETYPDILEAVFISLTAIPDILNLKIMKHPRAIARKIFKHILKDEQVFMENFKTPKGERVFTCILDNLVGYSVEAHEIAKQFLNMVMDETKLSLPELLYGGVSWSQVCDGSSLGSTQSKYSLSQFSVWREQKKPQNYPVVNLMRSLLRTAHNVNDETVKNNSSILKLLHNCFATYEMMISIRWDGKLYQAFQMLAIPREDSDEAVGFNDTFKKIISVAIQVISINDKNYDNFTKIIIQQSAVTATVPPNMPRNPAQVPQAANLPARPPPPTGANPQIQPANTQSFNINVNTFIDDEEYGLNIEDLDMEIKSWGAVIGAILKFLKTILLNETIFAASKSQMKKKSDKSKLTDTRLQIIFRMFDLIGRVDKSVRETAYQCLKELLGKEDHPKDLIQNDEKLKHILRPVLISLQLDFKKFTPSFLHMFRKILKLLTQCFNITLIQKLVDKLRQMEKTKQLQAANQTKALPQQSNKHLNYSEITLEVKCIANFLALFQHLAYAYHNHRSANYTVNSIILIFKYVGNICNYFTPKLGKHTVRGHIKTTLARVMNTMCEKITGQNIFVDGQERQLDLENFLQLISLEESFPLREKLTRETSYIDKALAQFSKNKKKDYVIFLEIILVLASKNNRWLKGFNTLGERLIKELNDAVQLKYNSRPQEKKQNENNEKNQIILLSKLLLEFIKQNPEDLKALFCLVNVFKLRSTLDLHFIRKYLKYDLYQKLSPDTKRQIFLDFLSLLRGPQSNDSEKVIAISQNIIYHFILIQVNKTEQTRQILIADEQLLKTFAETIRVCLNPRTLHNKNLNQSNIKQAANTYRIAIEILQISNLSLTALKNILSETHRNTMLLTVWGLLRVQDKIIKNYAFVWTSNYIRTFEGFDPQKALGLYLTLIRGLESLSQGDYEIGALIKKALNILIPYWDTKARTATSWIDWSLKAVHEQNNQPNKLVRFWEIVVKNHKIFHKFKSKFETQMVNSMQWLMVANNPTSTNPLVKKIASDMSFIYIEWKYKEAKAKLTEAEPEQRITLIQDQLNDRAAEICLNFFIKVALNNSSDKDDKEIMRRSLYLLKKTLILWPNTRKKFDTIKTIVNKLKSSNSGAVSQAAEMPLRFHYTLLNIIHILLQYEQDSKILPQLTSIFKLLELGGHMPPPRFAAGGPHNNQTGATIFTMNNIYLLNLLCAIVKRLVVIAVQNQKQDESQKLLQQIHQYIRDGFEYHVLSGNRSKTNTPAQQSRPNQQMKKIQIEVAVCFLKILYDIDPKCIDTHLNYIKQVTSSLKKMFEKGFENSNKNNSPNRVYELPPLTQGSFSEMLKKDLQIRVQLIRPEGLVAAEQNYEKDNIKSYATRRPLFVILLRILASKFNSIGHAEDQANILDIFMSIYEKIPDPELKIEVINIFKCMFIGASAFNEEVPERYRSISVVDYPIKKVFHLLLEDVNKFNEHFERRKSKPSDQNYNINERIYEQITTKLYFNFLCQFIMNIPRHQLTLVFLDKIKIFVLFAVKVADPQLFDSILNLIDKAYQSSSLELCVNLFEDYKQLNCTEQNLQGDQISLFFTFYLYRKALQTSKVSIDAFGEVMPENFHDHFLSFIKSDLQSALHTEGLYATLKTAFDLLPESKKLSKILTDYLVNGTYNEGWGLMLLRVALERNYIQPEDLYKISCKINEYGLLLKHLQTLEPNFSTPMLDYTYRAYGDRDLIYGYRMSTATSSQLRSSLLYLQQRKYVETLYYIDKIGIAEQSSSLKRNFMQSEWSDLSELKSMMDEQLINDMAKDCFKNLNQWQAIVDNSTEDVNSSADFLFHSSGNKQKIMNVIADLEHLNNRQFSYYYGKSILNFLESTSSQNKQLNISLLFALLEWLSFPKNARHNQNKMLVKIQCLLELQQGEKIKEESLTGGVSQQQQQQQQQPSLVDALTKVVQSVYTQINSWRERMPDKSEDLTVWNSILGQRIMIYDFMKNKMIHLLDSVVKNQNNFGGGISTATATEKLLIPYTDIEWNKLKLVKQQRYFKVFDTPLASNSQNLYLDQNLIFYKQNFYNALLHSKNSKLAMEILSTARDTKQPSSRDEQLLKAQRLEIIRLQAKVLSNGEYFNEANAMFSEATRNNDQNLLQLWRDWLVLCITAYEKEKTMQWAQLAITTLPYALRYKPSKTRLLLAPVFSFISHFQGKEQFAETLSKITDSLPIKPMIMWLPQLLRLAQNEQKANANSQAGSAHPVFKILDKLSICYTQTMYFCVKHLFRSSQIRAAKDVFVSIKKIYYNLITKVQTFAQMLIELSKNEKVNTQSLGIISRCIPELHIPLYQSWRGEVEPHHIPIISQFSEQLESEIVNGKAYPVFTLLGSDGKEYKYRLQRPDKDKQKDPFLVEEYEALLATQTLEVLNSHLHQWRQSSVRKLQLLQNRKLVLFYNHQQARVVRSSVNKRTPLDILNNHMVNETTFSSGYPQSDKQLISLPSQDRDSKINRRMKEIIKTNVLKDYLIKKSTTYDDFLILRRSLSYQYGVLLCLNYTLSIPTELGKFTLDLSTGTISVGQLQFNTSNPKQINPFSIRFSKNILQLFGKTYINAGILPAFISTTDALTNTKLNFKAYLTLLYEQLQKHKQTSKANLYDRLLDVSKNYEGAVKLMELGLKIGKSNDVPYNLKIWF